MTIALAAALLAGCASTGSSLPVRLATYTAAEQDEAAAALPAAAPILRRMIDDYGELRAQVRAVRNR